MLKLTMRIIGWRAHEICLMQFAFGCMGHIIANIMQMNELLLTQEKSWFHLVTRANIDWAHYLTFPKHVGMSVQPRIIIYWI